MNHKDKYFNNHDNSIDKKHQSNVTTLITHPSEIFELSRRQILTAGISISAFVSLDKLLKPSTAKAQSGTQKKLIWITMNGGWDILESTDPKPGSTAKIDVPYGWNLTHVLEGSQDIHVGRWLPNLARHGEDITVIRGLAMGTTSHDAGSTFMDTGILSNNGIVNAASISAVVASESQETIPIIQLSGGTTPKLDRGLKNGVSVVRAENLELYRSMYPSESAQKERKNAIMSYLKSSLERSKTRLGSSDRLSSIQSAQEKIQGQLDTNVASKLTLTSEDRKPFLDGLGTLGMGRQGNIDSFALALKLLNNDLVSCVNMGVGGFDTHSNQERSLGPVLQAFDSTLATLIAQLKASGKLDSTIIVVTSDFGRTPKINGNNGRDHWPVGGALWIGGGYKGARAIGGTDDAGLLAQNVDLTTGNVDSAGTQLNSSHLGGSILESTLGAAYLSRRSYLSSIPALLQKK